MSNSTIHERIKYLRKEKLHLTQKEFGNRLGSAGSTVVGWEKGDRIPPDATIKLICKEFNVSYAWITEGLGETFIETDGVFLEALLNEYDLDDDEVQLITKLANTYLQLDKSKRRVLIDFMKSLLDGQ